MGDDIPTGKKRRGWAQRAADAGYVPAANGLPCRTDLRH